MKKFEYMEQFDHEQLIYFYDKTTGLKGITCIHDTTLGPALGGTRLWNYADEEEAVLDVLRLGRGMTYKAACAGLNLGGGKTVLIGNPKEVKSEGYFRALGRYVQSLNGRYITAEDVNTCTKDMVYLSMETDYVVGLPGKSGAGNGFAKPRGIVSVLCHDQRVLREILYRLVRSDVSKISSIIFLQWPELGHFQK